MQIIPAVDVLGGAVVRLTRGSFDAVTRYGTDPAGQVEAWTDQGASIVHVVDLDAARGGEPDAKLWARLKASGSPFQLGGGIRTAEIALSALEAGAARVVVGTAAVWNASALAEILAVVSPARVVAALDVRDGRATGGGWLDEGRDIVEVAHRLESQGVVRALVTAVRSDGMMSGPDLDLLDQVKAAAPTLALIGSGGVGTCDDLVALRDAGAEGAIVGRALYEGRFTMAEALAAAA